jgi:Carboxymuconolactone decarboxylase family
VTPGVPPLTLFTTLARVPWIYERFRAGSLLDRGPVSLRHREIVIDRTCARCGSAYEWGVHVAFFAQRVALTAEQIRATQHGSGDAPVWSAEERLLIRLVDELHDTANISDALWRRSPSPRRRPRPDRGRPAGRVRSAGDADLAKIAQHAGMDEVRARRRGERVRGGRLLGLRQAPSDRGLALM